MSAIRNAVKSITPGYFIELYRFTKKYFAPPPVFIENTLFIDSTHCLTEMDILGGKFDTDKSPLSENSVCAQNRKGYTAVYDLLFSPLRNKEINFCEIGIAEGASLKLFSAYFTRANIYAFEYSDWYIEYCTNLKLPRTKILKTDVTDTVILDNTFRETGLLFDIIIDDSNHELQSQMKIITLAAGYLKSGGILIVEDLLRTDKDDIFNPVEKYIDEHFIFHKFITCHHDKRNAANNDKIWFAVKK